MQSTDLKFGLVLLDMDLYAPTKAALRALVKYDRLALGAVIMADEFFLRHYPGEKKACEQILGTRGWKRIYGGAAAKIWEG
jgi:hypothetical protein